MSAKQAVCFACVYSLFIFLTDLLETNYISIHCKDIHDFFTPNDRYLIVDCGSDLLFSNFSRDVAMAINFRAKLSNSPSPGVPKRIGILQYANKRDTFRNGLHSILQFQFQ